MSTNLVISNSDLVVIGRFQGFLIGLVMSAMFCILTNFVAITFKAFIL